MARYLFVVAHPDDEILGAGGFINSITSDGRGEIAVLVFNTCDTTRYDDDRSKIIDDLIESHNRLGIRKRYLYAHADSNFHNEDHREMVQEVEAAIRDFAPDYIFTQHPGDINTDHYWTAATCFEAARLFQRGREHITPIKGIYCMEVQSSTDWALNPAIDRFKPNTYVYLKHSNITAKIEALEAYENVVRDYPHPRSREAILAKSELRGTECGYGHAEAFECVFRRGGIE